MTRTIRILVATGFALAGLTLTGNAAHAQVASPCAVLWAKKPELNSFERFNTSHYYADQSVAPTSVARETAIAERTVLMNQEIFGEGKFDHPDIPSIEVFPADGVQTKVIVKTNLTTIPRIEVTNVGPSGVLKATLLLPVSGHTGVANAKAWALTDTYHVNRSDSNSPAETTLVATSKSLGSVTAHEVDIPLVKGGVTSILYYRSGSGGPSGYPEGRIYEIVWDGK